MPEKEIDIYQSKLVPKHELLTDDEKNELLKKLNVSAKQLPRIKKHDPAIKQLNAKKGNIIKVTRKSATAGQSIYYRVVID